MADEYPKYYSLGYRIPIIPTEIIDLLKQSGIDIRLYDIHYLVIKNSEEMALVALIFPKILEY